MDRIIHAFCPACGSEKIIRKLSALDHTVSGNNLRYGTVMIVQSGSHRTSPDQSAIGKYYQSDNYISHTDTKQGLINSIYHLVRKRTLSQKQQLVQQFTAIKKGRLLDIGAGTGAFAGHMKNAGWQVVGLEPDEETRSRASELHGIVLQNSTDFFQLEPGSFDAVSMWHVLEHVHQLHDYLEQIKKLLRETGKAFIAVPNYSSYDASVYGAYWAAYDVPRHLYHFSAQSMKLLLEKHGLKLNRLLPMWFDSFYVSMLSEQYKNGRANNAGAFKNGLLSNIKAGKNFEKCSSVIYVVGK